MWPWWQGATPLPAPVAAVDRPAPPACCWWDRGWASARPLLTVFFLRHQVPRSRFVAAQLVALLVQNLLKLIPLISLGILHLGNAGSALLLIPVTVIGNLSGQRFYRGASERLFFLCYQVLLLIGFAVSVALIVGRSRILALL